MNPTFFASYDSTLRRWIPYWAFVNAKIQHFNTGLLIFYRCDDCVYNALPSPALLSPCSMLGVMVVTACLLSMSSSGQWHNYVLNYFNTGLLISYGCDDCGTNICLWRGLVGTPVRLWSHDRTSLLVPGVSRFPSAGAVPLPESWSYCLVRSNSKLKHIKCLKCRIKGAAMGTWTWLPSTSPWSVLPLA